MDIRDKIQFSSQHHIVSLFYRTATCILGSCIDVLRPWLQCPAFSCNRYWGTCFFWIMYSFKLKTWKQSKHFFSYICFWGISVTDWHWDPFCLFVCFHTLSVPLALSVLWSGLSLPFCSTLAASGILFELYSVGVKLIDNMKALSRLYFDLTVFTNHHGVYRGGV